MPRAGISNAAITSRFGADRVLCSSLSCLSALQKLQKYRLREVKSEMKAFGVLCVFAIIAASYGYSANVELNKSLVDK